MNAIWEHFARTGAAGIADSLVLGFAVAAIVWAALGLLRRHRAATRFAVLVAALVSVAMLPLLRAFAHARGGAAATPIVDLGNTWATWVSVIWAAGVAIGFARLGFGLFTLRRIRGAAQPLTLSPELQDVVRQFCPSRRVDVLVSGSVSAPCAIGLFRPAVLIPSWIAGELSPSELRHILLHELSHLRRWDDWTNLLQRVVQALFFFHPAVWWIENRLSLEREMACDDAVLAHSASPRAYAECLARLAEKSMFRRGVALAQAAVSRMQQTSQRVARILRFDAAMRGSKLAVSFATLFVVSGFGVLLNAPTLIAFTPSPAGALASTESSPVTLASRKFRSHDAGPPVAVNASWHMAQPQVQPAKLETHSAAGGDRSVPAENRSRDDASLPRSANVVHTVRAIAKHPEPPVRALRASLNSNSAHEVTYFLVLRDQNSVMVWQISTWQYVPSQQVNASRKTT